MNGSHWVKTKILNMGHDFSLFVCFGDCKFYLPFLLEHIFFKMGSTEIIMSSVRLSVRYFSAGIAPRELKF
jgi:hypothetical protein